MRVIEKRSGGEAMQIRPSTCSADPIPATFFFFFFCKGVFNCLVDDVLAIVKHAPLTHIFSPPLSTAIVKPLLQKSSFCASWFQANFIFAFKVTRLTLFMQSCLCVLYSVCILCSRDYYVLSSLSLLSFIFFMPVWENKRSRAS